AAGLRGRGDGTPRPLRLPIGSESMTVRLSFERDRNICWGSSMRTGVPMIVACRLAGVATVLLLGACGQEVHYVAPPPPKVTVMAPVQQKVTRYLEATGSAAAVNSANLVARVSGFLQAIKYKDGDLVKQGDVLFVIEPEPYKLKLEQAQAAQASAE